MKSVFKKIALVILSSFVLVHISHAKDNGNSIPMIGDRAPSFKAQTTMGEVRFPEDYWNKWVVLFCHPADFTPVCTSELMKFADLNDQFEDLNCKLLGLSVDGINSHIQWISEIENIEFNGMKNVKINYPLISDSHLEIAKKYGMIHPNANSSRTVRGVYIIDDNQKIQAILIYPQTTGRNIEEVLRLVAALQKSANPNISIPEGWKSGDNFFLSPLSNKDEALERFKNQGTDYSCPAWFMCIDNE